MADTRKAKLITSKADMELLLGIEEKDITTSFIMENFGEFENGQRFRPYDLVTIPPGSYGPEGKKNKNSFTTTVGIWVFNKYFIEKDNFDLFKYINKTMNKKELNKCVDTIADAVMLDKVPVTRLAIFLEKIQKCMPYVTILSPSYTEKLVTCTKVINKKKAELLRKYKDDIEKGNEIVADKMEKELLAFALDYMKDDPSMDIFTSGAKEDIDNNFKNMFVMKGVIRDPDPHAKQHYKVAKSCYVDGISPEEYALFANSLAAGPFARAKKTANGGYREKLFLRAFQHLTLDPPESDCGTKRYLEVDLTEKNFSGWKYNYIIDRGKLVELTSDNKDKYIGKKVKMRFSALCESKTGFCHRCAGNMFYRLGKRNVGVALTQIASTQKNIAMKAFHDSTQKLYTMDLSKIFL